MTGPQLIIAEDLVAAGSSHISQLLKRLQGEQQRVSVALCGGSTPAPVYRCLAGGDLDAARLDLYFGDERCVPQDHPDSTFKLVQDSWLSATEGNPPQVFRMEGEDPDFDAAARRYEEQLPERLDLLILGVGEDGHTASLFPGNAGLSVKGRRVVHVCGPKPPPDRLTLTLETLREARHSVVLAKGAGKAEVLQKILEGPLSIQEFPAQVVRDGTWILDPDAAACLGKGAQVE